MQLASRCKAILVKQCSSQESIVAIRREALSPEPSNGYYCFIFSFP